MFFADFCTEVGVTFASVPFLNGSFVIINLSDPLEPIVFLYEGFQKLTGYNGLDMKEKCLNFSFLQSPETGPADVDAIRHRIFDSNPRPSISVTDASPMRCVTAVLPRTRKSLKKSREVEKVRKSREKAIKSRKVK